VAKIQTALSRLAIPIWRPTESTDRRPRRRCSPTSRSGASWTSPISHALTALSAD